MKKTHLSKEFREELAELFFACKGNPILETVLHSTADCLVHHLGDEIIEADLHSFIEYLHSVPDPNEDNDPSKPLN